jgi:hypothetical protein
MAEAEEMRADTAAERVPDTAADAVADTVIAAIKRGTGAAEVRRILYDQFATNFRQLKFSFLLL